MNSLSAFRAIRTIGTVLPSEALSRAVDLRMPGQTALDYQVTPGMAVNAAVARAWDAALGAHRAWKTALDRLPDADPATALTRDKWLLPLLYELGYGRPEVLSAGIDLPPGLGETRPAHYPISHQLSWPAGGSDTEMAVPLHLVGGGVALDAPTPGVSARAPQSMLQDFLNRSRHCLWGIVSNGHTVRLLRDASSLTKQSYVEFDLDDIFDNQRYAEFRLFFLTVHASRFAPVAPQTPSIQSRPSPNEALGDSANESMPDLAEETGEAPGATSLRPESCWLEQWRTVAIADGTRALDALRDGVALALTHLGTGFVSHPGNSRLLAMLAASPDADKDLHRALLRVAYRLIVLFVAEDRDLLHTASNDAHAQALYKEYFSTRRLRQLANSRTGSRHTDLWEAHLIVTDALAGDGLPTLALPGLAATLFDRDALGVIAGAALPNRSLLAAVRALAQIVDPRTGVPRPVDYRNLDSEELGGVYEGLLAYMPRFDAAARTFTLEIAPGNDRKKSGSYYTPSELITLILDETLDPLINEAIHSPDAEAALLDLTVLDPAVGSGHFAVAAARRIGTALASVRTGDTEPGPQALRAATADVIDRCIYGVDFNDLAAEITKVALWLEAFDGSRPFPFLDSHIRVGNSLLGATPALLRQNIPDTAFTVLGDDDKSWTSKLKARNKTERARDARQLSMFDGDAIDVETTTLTKRARELEDTPATTLAQVRARADAWRRLEDDPALAEKKLAADAWCAAFVQPKTPEHGQGITHDTLQRIVDSPSSVPITVLATVRHLAQQYRFFHWHLEFPAIFTVPDSGSDGATANTGWRGGFSCIIGNPPWDTLSPDTQEFFGSLVPDIRKLSRAEKDIAIALLLKDEAYQQRWDEHQRELFAIAHFLKRSGRYVMYAEGNLGKGDFNVYRSFAELALTHTRPAGYAGQILQSGIYAGANASAIRNHLLNRCTWTAVYGFDNKGGTWFPGVTLENFGAYSARIGKPAPGDHKLRAAFGMHMPETLASDIEARGFVFDIDNIRLQNPDTYSIPDIRDPRLARVSEKIYGASRPLGAPIPQAPSRDYSRELDMTNDSELFQSTPSGLPVYEGRMVDFFDHRAKRYLSGHGNSSLWGETPFGSQDKGIVAQWYVDERALDPDLRRRTLEYRIGFMNIADPGRQRSFCAAIIPPSTICGNKVPTVTFPDYEWYLPIFLALANSFVIDFIARQKLMSKTMTFNILDSLPIARLEQKDRRSKWLAKRSLRLTCTSIEMTPLWNEMAGYGWVEKCDPAGVPGEADPERRRALRAELDAFVARELYDLAIGDLELILDSFTQLAGIEQKAHGEFLTRRLVLEAYDKMR
ncbi:Eco57I restriction-modification methylase domain-containing protein [Kribbella speibonae]|uniref:site-specific DNA-methyltransferase (adenine-specific) n=1 Tax=Kribbella speibonae TaxID=1572660 RepID=A0A4R0IBD0_9ACTN|nr:N-6 DNA methylase [Kribbella speibonae]TCC29679.1 restriction endonuclease [Kribbella speibonae]